MAFKTQKILNQSKLNAAIQKRFKHSQELEEVKAKLAKKDSSGKDWMALDAKRREMEIDAEQLRKKVVEEAQALAQEMQRKRTALLIEVDNLRQKTLVLYDLEKLENDLGELHQQKAFGEVVRLLLPKLGLNIDDPFQFTIGQIEEYARHTEQYLSRMEISGAFGFGEWIAARSSKGKLPDLP